MGRLLRYIAIGIVAVFVIAAISGHHSASSSPPQKQAVEGGNNPSKNASESNTPRVGHTGTVEVDDLRWRLNAALSTATVGEGAVEQTANGVFVIANLSVIDNKSTSVTTTLDVVTLVAAGKSYAPDTGASLRLQGKSLEGLELGPGVTGQVSVAFDVAPQVLHEHPELRFNELGFGTTHGYIVLPRL